MHKLKLIVLQMIHWVIYRLNYYKRSKIKILPAKQTVDYIIEHKCSISRYGDGELGQVYNYLEKTNSNKSSFQSYDESLGRRLYEILAEGGNKDINLKVGLPGCFGGLGTSYLRRYAASSWEGFSNVNINKTLRILSPNIFLDSTFTRFYLSHRDKSRCKEFIEHVKKIWENRDLIIIEGEYTCLGIGNDLFAGAKSIRRILCPATDAWGRYPEILNTTLRTPPHDNILILCALGMTATVLAYDLAKAGYQAIDIGHIDIEYSWMLMGATEKVPVPGKFTNEAKDGHRPVECEDAEYHAQIIARI